MGLTIGAVIPTRFRPPQLDPLLAVLDADGVRVALIQDDDRFDHHIYRIWNAGWLKLEILGCQFVAFLSDDLEVLPGTLPLMARILSEHPEVGAVYPDTRAGEWRMPAEPSLESTTGTWGAGGMTGFCFMANSALPIPRFDTGYQWWYGDDAWEESVRRAGYSVNRIEGLPVRHTPNGSAGRVWDELHPRVQQDRARWAEAHNL